MKSSNLLDVMTDEEKQQSMEMRQARSRHSGMSLEKLRAQARRAEQAERNRLASKAKP